MPHVKHMCVLVPFIMPHVKHVHLGLHMVVSSLTPLGTEHSHLGSKYKAKIVGALVKCALGSQVAS